MGDSNATTAAANQVVRSESFYGGPMYEGARDALIAAGVVPPEAVFPGDRPGVRGPRFIDANGHIWKITHSPQRRGVFRVEWYLRPAEGERRHEARWSAHKAECERRSKVACEIRDLKRSLEREPNDAGQAREKCIDDVTWVLDRVLSTYLEPMTEDDRAEIGCLIDSIIGVAHSATIYFDPSKRQRTEHRLTELQAAEADRECQEVLRKIVSLP